MSYLLSLFMQFSVDRDDGKLALVDSVEVQDEAHDEAKSEFMEVANGSTDLAVPLGGLTTVKALLIISNQDVSFKINGGNTGVQVKTLFLRDCAVTALTVSNASGSTADVRILAVGT